MPAPTCRVSMVFVPSWNTEWRGTHNITWMTGLAWNEMNINVRVIRRTNISLFIKDFMHLELRHVRAILKSPVANVWIAAKVLSTVQGLWRHRLVCWRLHWFGHVVSISGGNFLSARRMEDVDGWRRRQRFGHGVQMRKHVDLENEKHLSILSRVFRIFGLDELVDLKVAE